jgi:glutamate--cysteine ligase
MVGAARRPSGRAGRGGAASMRPRPGRLGRRPGLKLQRDGREVALRGWAHALLDELGSVCGLLDEGLVGRPYAAALAAQRAKLEDPARLPSARLAQPLLDGQSFRDQTLALSRANHAALLAAAPDPAFQRALEAEVQRSFAAEAALRQQDAASGRSFAQFVVAFLEQTDTPPAQWLLEAAAAGARGGHRSAAMPPRAAARP